MKKLNYFLLAAAGLVLASCSQDEVAPGVANGDGNATFTVTLPKDLSTRAIGDGTAATNLAYYVYEVGGTATEPTYTYAFTGSQTFTGSSLSTTVNMELVISKNYKIVFFATNSAASEVYTVSTSDANLTVAYDKMTSDDNLADDYACFLGTYTTNTITSGAAINANVELTRPVAQVNWGSTGNLSGTMSNLKEVFGENGAYIQTTLSVNAYSTLNMLTGQCDGQTTVTLEDFAAPSTLGDDAPDFPETGDDVTYNYVAMQYLLAPSATSTNYDLTLTITNDGGNNTNGDFENKIVVSSAPVQANYQTNIYGSLLAASATFSVTKSDAWGGTNNMPLKWDGTTTYPEIPSTTDEPVVISKASDLAGLADMVSGTGEYDGKAQNFSDYTIELAADFDMGGKEFAGIGSVTRSSSSANGTSFKGTFDGQGHTISNVKITGSSTPSGVAAFLGNLDGATAEFKNVTFDNLQIDGNANQQAGVVGLVTNGATVSNVTVTSGSITSAEAAGAVVGRMMKSGKITECSNGATVSSSNWNVGGIVGAAYYTAEGSTMVIEDCENTGTISGNYGVGGIAGLCCAEVSGCNNSGSVTGTSASVGGIVGEQKSAGSIKDCTNTGIVVGGSGSSTYGAGGIVGWVRYQNDSNYARQNIIEVSGCDNSAAITGQIGVGGIVGVWFQCGICYNNTNTAPSLSANTFVAGIVGNSQWVANTTVNETIDTQLGSNVEGNKEMLYVQNNYSTTLESAMTGGCQANYVYVNTAKNTSVTGNSQTDKSVLEIPFNADQDTANNPEN